MGKFDRVLLIVFCGLLTLVFIAICAQLYHDKLYQWAQIEINRRKIRAVAEHCSDTDAYIETILAMLRGLEEVKR